MAEKTRTSAALILLIAVLLPTILAPAMIPALEAQENREKTLYVLNYSEYIDPAVLQMFENETGIHVVYDEYESAEEAWPKLKVGGQGYDLIIIAHTHVKIAIEQGLLHPLNKSLIPNLANLDPAVASHPADPNQDYAVPYMWGTTGIAYNPACNVPPPETWRQFFNATYLSQYHGKVSLLSEATDMIEPAMIALGVEPNNTAAWNRDTADKVIDLLLQVKPHIVGFYGASQYMPALANNEVCLAQAWNGDVLIVQDENPEVQYIVPRDGATFWVDYMVIPRDAHNVVGAHEFINFLLRPDIAARNVKAVWYAASIKKSLIEDVAQQWGDEELEEILNNPAVYPPKDAKLYPSPVLDQNMLNLVDYIRTRVMLGEAGGEGGTGSTSLAAIAAVIVAVAAVALYLARRAR